MVNLRKLLLMSLFFTSSAQLFSHLDQDQVHLLPIIKTEDERFITMLGHVKKNSYIPLFAYLRQLSMSYGKDVVSQLVNTTTIGGKTLLFHAAECGYPGVASILLGYGANSELATFSYEDRPLHILAEGRFIVDRSSVKNTKSKTEKIIDTTVKMYDKDPVRSLGDYLKCIEVLLEEGNADINALNGQGETPLHRSVLSRYVEIVEEFIRRGAVVGIKDVYGRTALHNAARFGYPAVVTALLEAGADVNDKDNDQRSPLDHAYYAFAANYLTTNEKPEEYRRRLQQTIDMLIERGGRKGSKLQ